MGVPARRMSSWCVEWARSLTNCHRGEYVAEFD